MIDLSHMIQDMTDTKVTNPYSGQSEVLTPEEAKRHDQIFLDELQATIDDQESGITGHSKHWELMRKNLDWFMKNNAKAYMVLLD